MAAVTILAARVTELETRMGLQDGLSVQRPDIPETIRREAARVVRRELLRGVRGMRREAHPNDPDAGHDYARLSNASLARLLQPDASVAAWVRREAVRDARAAIAAKATPPTCRPVTLEDVL